MMAKLGNIASARVSASVVGVSDSAGAGSSTDQYLLNEQMAMPEKQAAAVESSLMPIVESGLVLETALRFDDETDSYLSLREAGQQLESYEKTIEAYEDNVPKKTQGFG